MPALPQIGSSRAPNTTQPRPPSGDRPHRRPLSARPQYDASAIGGKAGAGGSSTERSGRPPSQSKGLGSGPASSGAQTARPANFTQPLDSAIHDRIQPDRVDYLLPDDATLRKYAVELDEVAAQRRQHIRLRTRIRDQAEGQTARLVNDTFEVTKRLDTLRVQQEVQEGKSQELNDFFFKVNREMKRSNRELNDVKSELYSAQQQIQKITALKVSTDGKTRAKIKQSNTELCEVESMEEKLTAAKLEQDGVKGELNLIIKDANLVDKNHELQDAEYRQVLKTQEHDQAELKENPGVRIH